MRGTPSHWPKSLRNVPVKIIEAIRLGRLTALSKSDGGVRGSSW